MMWDLDPEVPLICMMAAAMTDYVFCQRKGLDTMTGKVLLSYSGPGFSGNSKNKVQ